MIPVGTGRDLSVQNPNVQNPQESNQKMELNEVGKIVYDRIIWLEEQYEYVVLHNFVVMPNHVHAIIEIDSSKLAKTVCDPMIQQNDAVKMKSISSLMGAFKTTSSKIIHKSGFANFCWQRSFHDHIVRNEKSYHNISNYIN